MRDVHSESLNPTNRRQLLARCGGGAGLLGLATLLAALLEALLEALLVTFLVDIGIRAYRHHAGPFRASGKLFQLDQHGVKLLKLGARVGVLIEGQQLTTGTFHVMPYIGVGFIFLHLQLEFGHYFLSELAELFSTMD